MIKKYDGIVIGNGIGGLSFLYELASTQSPLKNKKWAVVFSHDLFLPCSYRTTSTVSLSRIDEGVSPLGDLLYNSFFHFKKNIYQKLLESYQYESSIGIEKITKEMVFFDTNEKKKALLRYHDFSTYNGDVFSSLKTKDCLARSDEDSYLIYPEVFQRVLLAEALKELDVEVISDFVGSIVSTSTEQESYFVLSGQQNDYEASFIFDGRGAYQREFASFYPTGFNQVEVEKRKLKTVTGSYLSCFLKNPLKNSFYIVIDDVNFIYRSRSNELIIGSTSHENVLHVPALIELKSKYLLLLNFLSDEFRLSMPNFSDFAVHTGFRSKAKKRTPVLEKVGDYKNYFAMSGLYKNGYTTSFFLSHEFFRTHQW